MALVSELNKVFPYFPMPNYPWARMTANVIHTMQREREVYMEGVMRVVESDGDVEMESPEEDVVPAEHLEEVEMGQRGDTLAETVVLPDVVPQTLESNSPRPRVTKTYSKKSAGTAVAGTKDSSSTSEPTCPVKQKVVLHVHSPAPQTSPTERAT